MYVIKKYIYMHKGKLLTVDDSEIICSSTMNSVSDILINNRKVYKHFIFLASSTTFSFLLRERDRERDRIRLTSKKFGYGN